MKKAISVMMLLASALSLAGSLGAVQAFSEPTLYVDPAVYIVNVNETFTVNINVENVTDLLSYETKLGFNRTILAAVAVEEGLFIKGQTSSPLGTFFLPILEDDFVHVACVTVGNYSGVNGSGTLFNVTFNITNAGTSVLHLYDSILLDSTIATMTHNKNDGFVSEPVLGDVNSDARVDNLDLFIVSLSYGHFVGEPEYIFKNDVNEDSIVDMRDLSLIAIKL